MNYAASLLPNGQRPQAAQCSANILPAILRASAVGLFIADIPSGNASASRIGPTIFFAHHAGECRARALVKNALQSSCIVMTGTEHPPMNVGFSIVSPRQAQWNNNARNVKSRHQRRQTTVKNPLRIASNLREAA
jgi:hypothetical protein